MQSAQIIACSKLITLHLLQSRQPTSIYSPHKSIVNCVHINHTNKVIASCGQDGRIVLVNAQKPDNQVFETSFSGTNNIPKPPSVNCIMFSSHSHYIAAGSTDCLVKIWDMKNHKHVYSTIKSHIGSVNSLAWIKSSGLEKTQGEILASASSVGDIFLHSVKSSNIIQTLNAKNQQVNQIKVSQSQGHCRLAACTSSGSVLVWNIQNLEKDTSPLCFFSNNNKSSITSVSFSSFNPVLLATSSVDETLTFYDIHQKKSVKSITSEEPLTSVNFHSDGHTLIAGGMYGGLFVYDLRKPSKPREKLIGHDSAVKYTVFIKQYEPSVSNSNMAASRASKSSSVNSFGSKAGSSKEMKQNQELKEPKQTKLNNFVDLAGKRLENTTQILSQGSSRTSQLLGQNKKQNIKLSATGQQAIKISENKLANTGSGFNKPTTSGNQGVSSGYNYYNKPGTETNTNNSGNNVMGNSNPNIKGNQYSVPKTPILPPNMQTTQAPQTQQKPVINLTYSNLNSSIPSQNALTNNLSSNRNNSNQSMSQNNMSQIKQFIEQRFQTLHMQMIHQFHLQQKEMKEMVTTLLTEDRRKNQRIKQLQNMLSRQQQAQQKSINQRSWY